MVCLFFNFPGNLLCFNFGVLFGITPAHMDLYESEQRTPLNKVTDPTGTALLTGYLFLSAAVGAAVSGCLAIRIGPKSVLLCSGLLQIVSRDFLLPLIPIYMYRIINRYPIIHQPFFHNSIESPLKL